MEQDLAVLTPEKAVVTYRLAGLGQRVGAHLLDVVILVGLLFGLSMFIGYTLMQVDPGLATGMLIAAFSIVPFLYFIVQEGLWNGQTLGKKATGVRVRMADGTPITFGASLGRNLLRVADLLPGTYLLGLIAVFTNPRSQRIGDLVAGTVVVTERRVPARYSVAPHTAGIHPLEHAVGELRGMTQEEYLALRRYADRFPELPTNVQQRLTREVFLPIAERASVPPMPTVHPIYVAEAMVMKYGREHGLL